LRLPLSVSIYPNDGAAMEKGMVDDTAWFGLGANRAAEDEARVRRGFWLKVKRVAAQLPFVEDLLAAYYCAFDRNTPLQVKAMLVGALAYFVLPFDAVPDVMPLLGFTDDAAVLATAVKLIADHLRPEHRDAARRALARGLDEE
jgi:uncharacterized membrane protein YkvA (DUF1232 family)